MLKTLSQSALFAFGLSCVVSFMSLLRCLVVLKKEDENERFSTARVQANRLKF